MATTIRDEKIMDRWAILIAGAQGQEETIFNVIKREISDLQPPGLKLEMEQVQTSILKGLFGKKRQFLRIMNEALKDHRVYVGARDYGKQLSVSWFLTCEPGFFKRSISDLVTKNEKAFSFVLDVFDQQELQDYVTTVHHASLKAVEALMAKLGQDPTKIDRKSKGFLGLS